MSNRKRFREAKKRAWWLYVQKIKVRKEFWKILGEKSTLSC